MVPSPNSTIILSGHKDCVRTVAWNVTGTRLASGSTDKTIRVWNPEKPLARYSIELKGHTQTVDQLCWDPTNPDQLASASPDKSVRFWDYRAQKCIKEVPTKGENINIAWSPDGAHVAVASRDDIVTIIDARQHKIVKSFKEPLETNEMTWSHSGDLFLLTNGAGRVKILAWPSLEVLHTLEAHTSNCFSIEFDPRGRYLAVGGADAIVSLWDLKEWICVRTFDRLDWPVRTLSFSYDGVYLASGSEDLAIDIGYVETAMEAKRVTTTAATNSVAWHPGKHWLAYAGEDKDGSLRILVYQDSRDH